MKRFLLGVLFLSFFAAASAQDELLISDKIQSGGFGGPVWKVTRLNGETALISGGRGGWIINHGFVIGGGGYGTLTDVETGMRHPETGETLYLRMEYSGLELEYVHRSGKMVHWTVLALVGGGQLEIRRHDPDRTFKRDGFMAADAHVNVEINVLRWIRVNAGAGYRLAFGIDTIGLSESDIGGPEAQVTLKFGSF
jgi:hypothetical protein